jgi:membrane protein DedA with SNARE-associated domain
LGVVQTLLRQYSFAALVLILFLDSSGVPWPTEATLVATGVAVQTTGHPNVLLAWLSGLIGAAMGSSLSYYLGRKLGPTLMNRIAAVFHLTPQHLAKVDEWFTKYGHRAVFFGRLIPFVRNLAGYPAGVAEMPFGKYLLFSVAGYGCYTGLALALGFGGSLVGRWLAELEAMLWIAIPLALLVVYWKWGRAYLAKRRGKG